MSGTNDNTEEIEELTDFLRVFADANDGGEFEPEQCEKLRDAAAEIDRLRAELAALKNADPLAEMWAALAECQPQADRDGHGESWRRMCEERTLAAARDAARVAAWDAARHAAWYASWAAPSDRAASDAIAAIRRAKEAKP